MFVTKLFFGNRVQETKGCEILGVLPLTVFIIYTLKYVDFNHASKHNFFQGIAYILLFFLSAPIPRNAVAYLSIV